MRFVSALHCSVLLCLFVAAPARAKLQIMATTTDLAALVAAVGGDQAEPFSVAKGTQDPHQIEAKPSYMVRFHGADLVVAQGLELESAWLQPLIDGARNPKILMGANGFLALGFSLEPLEIPDRAVSRAEGDVHPGGNPHFHLDPLRMGKAALLVAERLGLLLPDHKDLFHTNAQKFKQRMEEKTEEWQKRITQTGIKEVITHHKTLNYFCHRFSLKCEIQLEPKPGIPPTVSHLLEVIAKAKSNGIRLVLIENYFDDDSPRKLKSQIPGLRVERVPVSVGGEPGITNSEQLYERLVKIMEGAR